MPSDRESRRRLKLGAWAERRALRYLQGQGLRYVSSNYRCRLGEIDLIMEDGRCLVFVEVRYRRSARFGGALVSVDARKQARLRRAAEHYRQTHSSTARNPCRFDVIGIEDKQENTIQWIKNAF